MKFFYKFTPLEVKRQTYPVAPLKADGIGRRLSMRLRIGLLTGFTTFLCLGIVLGVILFLGARQVQAAEELSPPTIVINPDIYYPLDEVLYLEGNAKPGLNIQIRFQKQGAKPLTFTAKSDARGEWVLAEKVPLEAGDWEVRARTVDPQDPDNASEWSNPRVFKVIISGIIIGGITIKFAALSLTIIVLLICGIVLILYFNYRVRRLKTILISKEIREAQESVREGFAELRQNLLDELRILESRQNLSQEELAKKEHLLKDLENLERGMQNEIKDIEERL